KPLSIFIIDLDQFKSVNDTYGHTRGDFLLREFGVFLKNSFRGEDTVFRYGGDEFVCLLPGVDYARALKIAERLIENVNSHEFAGIKLTLSIGISTFPEHALDWKSLFDIADKSLYYAKRKGRNRIGVFVKEDIKLTIPTAKMVGRNQEIEKIRNHIVKLFAEKRGGAIFIGGQVGVGKTRFVKEIVKEPIFSNIPVLISNLSAASQSIPYYPFREIIQSVVSNTGPDIFSNIPNVFKIEIAKVVPHLSPDIGYLDSNIAFLDKFRLFEGVRTILAEYCRKSPIFCFIDNLHWTDANSLDLLQYLIRAMRENQIIFFLIYRSEELKTNTFCQNILQLIARENLCEKFDLMPLGYNECKQMIYQIINGDPPAELVEYIFKATGGNPFFIEELIKSLESSRVILYDSEMWKFDRTKKFSIPYSVLAVFERRFSMLNDETRDVLEHAAVIGRSFDVKFLKDITGINEGQLFDLLDETTESGFLVSHGDNYYFAEDVIREAIYSKISEAKLKHFHRKIGQCLLDSNLKCIDNIVEELARHFYVGGIKERAIEYGLLAGDKAKNAYAYQSAVEFYSWALDYLKSDLEPAGQEKIIECLKKRSDVLSLVGKYEESLSDLNEAMRISENIGNNKLIADCLVGLSNVHLRVDKYDLSKQNIFKALAVYDEINDDYGKMVALNTTGVVHWYLGDYMETIRCCQESLVIAKKINNQKYEGINLHTIANAYSMTGDLQEAIRYYQESLDIARRIGDLFEQGRLLNNIGVAYRECGQYSESLKCHFDSLEIIKDIGTRVMEALNLTNIGAVYMKQGQVPDALHYYQKSIRISRETNDSYNTIENLIRIGEIYVKNKDYTNAEMSFNEAYSISSEIGYKYGKVIALDELIGLNIDKGNLAEVEKYLNTVMPLVEELNSKDIEADVLCSWGRLYTAKRDWSKAEECFNKSLRLFEGTKNRYGFATVSYYYGLMFGEQNDEIKARRYLSQARQIFFEIGAQSWVKEIDEKIDTIK
ncbi:MAG: tetratricopeptide repeat protein, partial [candidate division WOR-3 bacterium]